MQRKIFFTILLYAISPHSWSATDLEQARQLMNDGHFKAALDQTTILISQQPAHIEAQFIRGVTLSKMKRPEEAIEVFEDLLKSHPDLPEPRNNLAVLYAQQGHYQKAEQALQSAINTHPSYAAAHGNLSNIYRKLASVAYNTALNNNKETSKSASPELHLIERLYSHQAISNNSKQTIEAEQISPEEAVPTATTKDAETSKTVDINRVTETVLAWAHAWSQQDPNAYLAHYSTDFTTPAKLDRATWEQTRHNRLTGPEFIQIKLTQMEAQLLDDKIARVSFNQHYRSNRFAETVAKFLMLRLEQDRWQIVSEIETK